MPQKQVKLIDIANKLNVSIGLVSIVLSGKSKERRISDELAAKVIETAKALGYRPNQLARGLRTGKSGIIGLLVADISNPFFGKMARYIENEAAKLEYQVMFGSSDENPEKLENLVNMFASRQVDGMIIVPVFQSESFLLSLQEQSIPFVFIDRYCEGVDEDAVVSDNYLGSYQLTSLLIKKGYGKIAAFANDLHLSNIKDRMHGYTTALKDSGLNYPVEDFIFEVDFDQLDTRLEAMLKQALENGCDAFFFANNKLGISSLKYFDKVGLTIPEDIGIVCFDNPEAFQVAKPGITCVEQPIELMCAKAINILSRKIEGKTESKPERISLPGKLIVRESC
ncbi:MAG: LacI family DNA-binding transcriptional regulator [Bacteroidales bacterium]|nr:LacI family DNA-binding transcriptional regulator [Bacteroidales bacterium]